jgi:hypothetical protein
VDGCRLAIAVLPSVEDPDFTQRLAPVSETGIPLETSSGPRSRVWRSPEVIAALDAFADRARRGGLGRWQK